MRDAKSAGSLSRGTTASAGAAAFAAWAFAVASVTVMGEDGESWIRGLRGGEVGLATWAALAAGIAWAKVAARLNQPASEWIGWWRTAGVAALSAAIFAAGCGIFMLPAVLVALVIAAPAAAAGTVVWSVGRRIAVPKLGVARAGALGAAAILLTIVVAYRGMIMFEYRRPTVAEGSIYVQVGGEAFLLPEAYSLYGGGRGWNSRPVEKAYFSATWPGMRPGRNTRSYRYQEPAPGETALIIGDSYAFDRAATEEEWRRQMGRLAALATAEVYGLRQYAPSPGPQPFDTYLELLQGRAVGSQVSCRMRRESSCQLAFIRNGQVYEISFRQEELPRWREIRASWLTFLDEHRTPLAFPVR